MTDLPDPLTSLQDSEYLRLIDLIDNLRLSGADRYISLPQLVVCGDQSSGKSSVLEAISGVHFPSNSGQCTRFVTEVSLRRTPNEAASASIIPGPQASQAHKQRLLEYQERNVSLDQVPRLIEAAKVSIGIGDQLQISDDKLRLEIQGPELPNFSLIDTPGIIHGTSDSENQLVEGLVFDYMKRERSIILAVVCTEAEVIGQKVLNLVKKVDVDGRRTVGIITKPDLITRGRKPQYLSLARNEDHKLRRGWHVVRNRDSAEEEPFDAAAAEQAAFRDSPWNELPSNKLGINHLREHMKAILLDEIRQYLPDVVSQIGHEKAACDAELEYLGPSRSSRDEQLRFLLDVQASFKTLVEDGVVGRYQSKYLNDRPDERLRNTIRHLNDGFSKVMEEHGHFYHITDVMSERTPVPPDIESPESITAIEYIQKIRSTKLEAGRSQELPNHYDTSLTCTVFREQSQRWDGLARMYLTSAFGSTEKFLLNALESVTTPLNAALLWNCLIKPEMEKRRKSLEEKLQEVMKPYREFLPYSTPKRYKSNHEHFQQRWKHLSSSGSFTRRFEQITNGPACKELLLDMLAYYDNALETFTDNLISLAVESHLLDGLPDLISANLIATMSNEKLSKYAAESEDTITRRAYAQQKQETLRKSLDILQDQLWTSVPLSFNSGQHRAPLDVQQHLESPHEPPATSVSVPAGTSTARNDDLEVHRRNGSRPEIVPPRTPEPGNIVPGRKGTDSNSRRASHTLHPSDRNIFDDLLDGSRSRSQTNSSSPTPATPSSKASAESVTSGTEYSSLRSSPGASGGWRHRRRRSHGRASSQAKVAVPVSGGSDSDSGMSRSRRGCRGGTTDHV
jgi:GTPase SAR1 family protein